jgi:UDP-N-acetyl-2-amino-2-deoxyglucuronate dehydrogenase
MEGVEEIRNAVEKAAVKSVTSFVLRWNPQFETTKQLIADGVLGEVIYAEGDYWHPISKLYPCYDWMMTKDVGGSATVAAGCHAVDALRWFAGDIEEVTAFSRGAKLNLDYEYDPVSVACVRFENGAIGKLATLLDGETPYIFNTRLFGTTGTIMNNEVFSRKHYPGATDYWKYPTVEPDSGDVAHHPFVPEVAHFMECIENDVESHASIHDSWKSMAVCFAIDESAAQGGVPVRVAEIAHV